MGSNKSDYRLESDNYEWVLAISFAAHDGSITLLKDGKVDLFIKEERISRDKHDSTFPFESLNAVAKHTRHLDKLLVSNLSNYDHLKLLQFHLEKLNIIEGAPLPDDQVESSDEHHLHHAACGFYASGFDEAICVVVDGWGSTTDQWYDLDPHGLPFPSIRADESTSVYEASFPNNFKLLDRVAMYDQNRRDGLHDLQCWNSRQKRTGASNFSTPSVKKFFSSIPNVRVTSHMDIGIMYGVTSSYLGFDNIECGKTMGLSAFGKEDDSIPPFFLEGTLRSNKHLFTQSRTLDEVNYPELEKIISSDEKRANLAYKMQKSFEKVYEEIIKSIDDNYECKNIVLSGGCALNVVNNAVLTEKFPHMNFFIDPIPNDAGQSLGHALLWSYDNGPIACIDGHLNDNEKVNFDNLFLGPKYDKEELKTRILEAI